MAVTSPSFGSASLSSADFCQRDNSMKNWGFFLMLTLGNPAMAEDMTMVTPVFSQIVVAPLPAGFKPIYEDANAANYILEAVPQTETLDNWTQMLTLTGAKGRGGREGAALDMANAMADLYGNLCPDDLVAEPLPVPNIPGASEVFAAFLGCTAIPGSQPEAMVLLVMAGDEDLYTLQWAERAQAPVTYDLANWTPRLAALTAKARLCTIVSGEAPPYPSCVGS